MMAIMSPLILRNAGVHPRRVDCVTAHDLVSVNSPRTSFNAVATGDHQALALLDDLVFVEPLRESEGA